MPTLADFDIPSFAAELESQGEKRVHAPMVLREFHHSAGSPRFDGMSLPKTLRQRLEQVANLSSRVIARTVSGDGTTKLLIGFPGGGTAEAVLMLGFKPDVAAGCVSSQIGCAMGCDFCASTKSGLERNLTAGEIVEQYLHLRAAAASLGRRLKTLVFMGMGEPMHNLDAVIAAIRRIADPLLGALGWKHITVSTVGIAPGIDRLAAEDLNVHLALSLHAPDDETRAKLVPMNRRYPISEIIAAAKRFQDRCGRISTIEYCMLADVNDSDEQAKALADLMNDFRAHVNLIPYNAIGAGLSGIVYRRPSQERMNNFIAILRERGVTAHFRHTRGDDVAAACGQLRANH
jgi:23S rRNA (adenine2503-C2)-methyltransferase